MIPQPQPTPQPNQVYLNQARTRLLELSVQDRPSIDVKASITSFNAVCCKPLGVE